MKKFVRFSLSFLYIIGSLAFFYFFVILLLNFELSMILIDWTFWGTAVFYLFSIEEIYVWVKNGRRSEMSDIVAIAMFFFLILFITKDLLTSIMGAFSIYLWVGVIELREYPVINKLLIISLVTYNVIFIAGIFSFYLDDSFYVNTAFAFSFWIILALGFLLFGRKYIVVWRFLSPTYLTLFLYIIAWLAVIFINQYTPINFNFNTPIGFIEINMIYPILILVNWMIYFVSGPILDKLLAIKKVKDQKLLEIVEDVKDNMGIKSKVKVGFGKYPILNAMAYGSFFDKRIAIISESLDQIPEDELRGIVAHELAHTKGKHTLILTLIATTDLLIRMILGFPATYYDYTFGNPEIPLIWFIFLNIGIYLIIFVFIRYLEGKADLMAKEKGYAKPLAKALYNLESFYASGREIGLNTMLLCDEKITRDNQMLDYMETAEYLNKSMITPSRASLLANFMNSHPPSYFRIAALLGDELKPGKEAILPLICLKKENQRKYAKKFKTARKAFKQIADNKFKEKFGLNDISRKLDQLNRKEIYQFQIKYDYVFINKISGNIEIGKLEDVKFFDNLSESDYYVVEDYYNDEVKFLNTIHYTKIRIYLNAPYFFEEASPLILKKIALSNDRKEGEYIFIDKNDNEVRKSIKNTKLPISTQFFKQLEKKDLFFRKKGKLLIRKCVKMNPADEFQNYSLTVNGATNKEEKDFKLGQLIIRPNYINLPLSKSLAFRRSEIDIIEWLITKQIRSRIFLKKPVNNLQIGYIKAVRNKSNMQEYDEDEEKFAEGITIVIQNVFGQRIEIEYKKIELISFEHDTALIQLKSETSILSRLGYRILHKFKPQKVIV
ncbi:MAG: M48 family metalloprotease [Candidatus Lokiarchaeota archaeon]|nr:M48 family metalloprotease [Candidatus Lokiarchaeota archaeon]MBD3339311.1 M48 family metalloprotease [Candidatus Lokiarchaeota archaeon]